MSTDVFTHRHELARSAKPTDPEEGQALHGRSSSNRAKWASAWTISSERPFQATARPDPDDIVGARAKLNR